MPWLRQAIRKVYANIQYYSSVNAAYSSIVNRKHVQLREYLSLLIENSLIEYEGDQTYRTTEKGMRLLHLLNEIDELAPVSFIKE